MSERDREAAEKGRVSAEGERERREDLRRISEGRPEQHVPGHDGGESGRIESEEGRVFAEHEREDAELARTDVRGFYLKMAVAVGVPLAFVALIPALFGFYLLNKETDERIAQNRMAIERLASLERAKSEEAIARCYSAATQGPVLRRVLLAIEGVATDPKAQIDLRELRRLNALQAPTIRECRQLADKLGVKPQEGVGG